MWRRLIGGGVALLVPHAQTSPRLPRRLRVLQFRRLTRSLTPPAPQVMCRATFRRCHGQREFMWPSTHRRTRCMGSPLASRYALYDDGTFALQYSTAPTIRSSSIAELIGKRMLALRSSGKAGMSQVHGARQDRLAMIPLRFGTTSSCSCRISRMAFISEHGNLGPSA